MMIERIAGDTQESGLIDELRDEALDRGAPAAATASFQCSCGSTSDHPARDVRS